MSLLTKLFGKPGAPPPHNNASGTEDPLVPVPIPALGILLLNLEKQKGAPLSEHEVLQARDKAVCMMLPLSKKRLMDEKRGYEDINPENAWQEWQAFRAEAQRDVP